MATTLDPADPSSPVTPSREDGVVAAASEVLGGPMGRHAVIGARGVAGALVCLVLAVSALVAAGVVERAHCINAGWATPDHFWHACYSDIPVVYGSSGLSSGANPFQGKASAGQPLPTTAVMLLLAKAVPGNHTGIEASRWYFGLWSVLVAILLVGLCAALVRAMPRHPWRVAHLASPALPFLALVSFEAVPVALVGLGLVAWARRRPVVAGVLLGLACLARPWSILVVVALGLLSVRTGRLPSWLVAAGTALATALVVLELGVVTNAGSLASTYSGWWSSVASYGSPWFLPALAGAGLNATMLSAIGVAGWVAAIVTGAYMALSLPRRPRVGELVLVMLVVAMLTGKSLPVQAGLWMILLMALVGVRWRTHLVWAGVEVAYFVAVWLHIAAASAPDRGLPGGWYAVFLVARLAAWAFVAAEVWHTAARRRPALPVAAGPGGSFERDDEPQPALAGATRAATAAASTHEGTAVAAGPQPADGGGPAPLPAEAGAPGGATAVERTQTSPSAVIDDDELAGPFHGAPDDTVVTFV